MPTLPNPYTIPPPVLKLFWQLSPVCQEGSRVYAGVRFTANLIFARTLSLIAQSIVRLF